MVVYVSPNQIMLRSSLASTVPESTHQKWQDYNRWRDQTLARVAVLKQKADREHKKMLKCAKRSRNEHSAYDRELLDRSYLHAQRRDQYRAEAHELSRQLIRAARLAKVGIIPHMYRH